MQGFRITTSLDDMDLDVIYQFISNSYWGKGIPRGRLRSHCAIRSVSRFWMTEINSSLLLG